MKRSKEADKKWMKIIVEIDGEVKKYDLNKSEKLSHKFQTKLRKNVTKKYKEYIKSHPNMKVINMEELTYDQKQITNDIPTKTAKQQQKSYTEKANNNPNNNSNNPKFDEKAIISKESDNDFVEDEFFI